MSGGEVSDGACPEGPTTPARPITTTPAQTLPGGQEERNRRFHALYDRLVRPDVLWRAWQEVRANGGSAGVDGIGIEDVEREGVQDFLDGLARDLSERMYRPKPVMRVYIPKPDGRKRPLGIPRSVIVWSSRRQGSSWSRCSRPVSGTAPSGSAPGGMRVRRWRRGKPRWVRD